MNVAGRRLAQLLDSATDRPMGDGPIQRLVHPAAAAAALQGEDRRIRLSINSRTWYLLVNVIAASHYVPPRLRQRIYQRCGIDTKSHLIHPGCWFYGNDIRIGSDCWIQHRVYFDTQGGIEIGNHTGIGQETMLLTSTHDIGELPVRRWGRYRAEPVVLDDDVWLGSRVLVLPGVHVATGCIVASGAVVTKDCEPNGFYAGVPARRVREL